MPRLYHDVSVIGRTVIHDQQFEIRVSLLQYALHG